jgi:hypothetical protein
LARIELSIASDYVNWGVAESVRELIQNAKDAEDIGTGQAIIKYRPSNQTLKITTKGASITRDKLVLGVTTKRDDNRQRGQFGEGFKLAFACLLRNEVEVLADVGTENWRPALEHSETFDSEILVIHTRAKKDSGEITIQIKGVTPEHWEEIVGNTLFLQKSIGKHIGVPNGQVLMNKKHQGRLYSRGLYICRMPERNHKFGYDLSELKVDRDRRMIDKWDVHYAARQALSYAFLNGKLNADDIYALLEEDCAEARILGDEYISLAIEVQEALAEVFRARHGEGAIPVVSAADSFAVEHVGHKGVVVSVELKMALRNQFGDARELVEKMSKEAKQVYSAHELGAVEKMNFLWVLEMVENAMECDPNKIRIVDFHGDNLLGLYRGGEVDIAKKILEDREELIATVVHEFAHQAGPDGSVQHEREVERLFAKTVVHLAGLF